MAPHSTGHTHLNTPPAAARFPPRQRRSGHEAVTWVVMSAAQRGDFLAGVLSTAVRTPGRTLVIPVWYSYQPGGLLTVLTGHRSRRPTTIRVRDRTFCAPLQMRSRASRPVSFRPFGSGRGEGAENIYVARCITGGPALFGDWARDSRDGLKAGGQLLRVPGGAPGRGGEGGGCSGPGGACRLAVGLRGARQAVQVTDTTGEALGCPPDSTVACGIDECRAQRRVAAARLFSDSKAGRVRRAVNAQERGGAGFDGLLRPTVPTICAHDDGVSADGPAVRRRRAGDRGRLGNALGRRFRVPGGTAV